MNSYEHELKQRLAAAGVSPTHKHVQDRIKRAEDSARLAANRSDKVNDRISTTIRQWLGYLAVFFVSLFLVIGSGASILMFPIAETIAIREGIYAFSRNDLLATFNAATIVIGLVVLLFVKYALADNLTDSDSTTASLRDIFNGFMYWLGIDGYEPTERSRSALLYMFTISTLRLLKLTIVLLGFLGRIAGVEGIDSLIYLDFIGTIVTSATALEFIGYVGTIALTIALIAVTDIMVLFFYRVFTMIAPAIDLSGKQSVIDFLEQQLEQARIATLEDMVIQAEAKHQQRTNSEQNNF